jgi:hypothetical protein
LRHQRLSEKHEQKRQKDRDNDLGAPAPIIKIHKPPHLRLGNWLQGWSSWEKTTWILPLLTKR